MENGLSTIESFVILIVIAAVFLIVMYYAESKKKTKREKIADAVDKFAESTSDFFSNTAHKIFDSPETKQKEKAVHEFLITIDKFRGHKWYYDYGHTNEKIDEAFEYYTHKQSLDVLNISKSEWIKFGGMCYYAGILEDYNYSEFNGEKKKLSKESRMDKFHPNSDYDFFIIQKNNLIEALEYFHISANKWIEYGDVVLDMYGIRDKIHTWCEQVFKRNGLKE